MQGHLLVFSPESPIVPIARLVIQQPPTLEELQKYVGGWIEQVPGLTKIRIKGGMLHECVAFCNEEGKLLRLPANPLAQQIWENCFPQIRGHDHLVGNVIIVFGDDKFMAAMRDSE
jgi:hypothetical protein